MQQRGAWQPVPEGGQELTLTQIARTFGFTTNLGEPLQEDPGTPLAGDEAWGQSLLPRVNTSGAAPPTANPAQGSFNPTGNFNIVIAGYTTNTTGNLGVRLWPVEFDGTVVPGAYFIGQDFVQNGCGSGSANCDYQDNVYLVTNIAPVASLDTSAPAAPGGAAAALDGNDVDVTWTPVADTDVAGYVVERQPAGTTTWTRLNATPINATRFTDTTAPGNVEVTYRVLAVDTSNNASAPSATAAVTTPPSPQAAIRINAGGPAATTGGVEWGAQQYGTGGTTYTNTTPSIAGTTDDVLYHSEYSTATGSIDFDVPVENGDYEVRLHVAEIYFQTPGGTTRGGVGSRVFDVAVEGVLRIDDYDIIADVGPATAAVKS